MKNINEYENIIFDLGGVILNLDYEQTVIEFKKLVPQLDPTVFYGKEEQLPFYSDYEMGKITTIDFVRKFNAHHHINLGIEIFTSCWNAMILDFPIQRIELIRNLRFHGKKIYLLSNINELHEQAVEKSFQRLNLEIKFLGLFDNYYYSHKIRLRKPTSEIFSLLLNENSIAAGKTLFIDDSLHHVLGARTLGIDSIHLEKPVSIENLNIFRSRFGNRLT